MRSGWEIIDTRHPTPGTAPFVISYDVMDFSGNIARTQYRLLFVDCPPPMETCGPDDNNNYYCGRICGVPDKNIANATNELGSTEELMRLINTPPVVRLAGPPTVRIKAGTPYTICPKGGESRTDCDLGAIATDREDGQLTYRIKVCEALGYQSQTMFYFVGVSACGITATSPPGIYYANFTVEDTVGAIGYAVRTIRVEENCPSGLEVCDDMRCPTDSGSCDRYDLLEKVRGC